MNCRVIKHKHLLSRRVQSVPFATLLFCFRITTLSKSSGSYLVYPKESFKMISRVCFCSLSGRVFRKSSSSQDTHQWFCAQQFYRFPGYSRSHERLTLVRIRHISHMFLVAFGSRSCWINCTEFFFRSLLAFFKHFVPSKNLSLW